MSSNRLPFQKVGAEGYSLLSVAYFISFSSPSHISSPTTTNIYIRKHTYTLSKHPTESLIISYIEISSKGAFSPPPFLFYIFSISFPSQSSFVHSLSYIFGRPLSSKVGDARFKFNFCIKVLIHSLEETKGPFVRTKYAMFVRSSLLVLIYKFWSFI